MISRPSRFTAVVLLATAFVLGGCSSSPITPATGTSTSTTSGTSISSGSTSRADSDAPIAGRSASFTVAAPQNWSEQTSQAEGVANIDLVLLSSTKVASFANNLVVLSSDGDQARVESEVSRGRTEMGGAGRTVTETPDKQIGGVRAKGFATAFEQQGIKVLARSYGMHHNGKIYLLTLSASQDDADHAMSEFDEIIASWTWS